MGLIELARGFPSQFFCERIAVMKMPMPDDWNGEDFCTWAVCWPNSTKWKAILYGLLESPTYGRFWDFGTGNFLSTRQDFAPAYGSNFELEEVVLSCNEAKYNELIGVLRGIGSSVASSSAAGCGCPGGTKPGVGNPIEGGVPPDGFGDAGLTPGTPEWTERKCGYAHLICDWFEDGLQRMIDSPVEVMMESAATLGFGLVAAAIASVLTGLVFVEVVVIIGLTAALLGQAAEATIDLVATRALVVSVRQELICAMMSASSGEEARQNISDVLYGAGGTNFDVYLVASFFFANDVSANLFYDSLDAQTKANIDDALDGYVPSPGCAACQDDLVKFEGAGQLVSGSMASEFVASSSCFVAFGSPRQHVKLGSFTPGDVVGYQFSNGVNLPSSLLVDYIDPLDQYQSTAWGPSLPGGIIYAKLINVIGSSPNCGDPQFELTVNVSIP